MPLPYNQQESRMGTLRACMVLLGALVGMILVTEAATFNPRRIMFARCTSEEKIPRAVFMTCANRHGVCEVRVGNTHNLRAIFISDVNSTDVDSHVRWNSWFEVPLPNQRRNACEHDLPCPIIANRISRFTYTLDIQDFWPRDEYPVIWSLTDRATDTTIFCFKFKINIV
ncbi:hypothetical protein Pmani_016867 [Petrolisthes manimaculis]|uniref:MD-2-related lipid-recognition domain-containing protein n=1 Tax=Petrolisthes manimaculis TaxID=1843537 RepID=A0AAE1PNE9_9EUCA|nr:hypothetical protein Pmani_016867 [Petrolisthes manimaculis]